MITPFKYIWYLLLLLWIWLTIFKNVLTTSKNLERNVEWFLLLFSHKITTLLWKYSINRVTNMITPQHSCIRMQSKNRKSCWAFLFILLNCSDSQFFRPFDKVKLFLRINQLFDCSYEISSIYSWVDSHFSPSSNSISD